MTGSMVWGSPKGDTAWVLQHGAAMETGKAVMAWRINKNGGRHKALREQISGTGPPD